MPLSFDPGEAYQFDWSHEYARLSGVTTKVKAAHMRLCYSRMQLVQIFPRERQEMAFEAHERAFRFFGGVCRRGIYDNMKTAVSTVFVRSRSGTTTAASRRCVPTIWSSLWRARQGLAGSRGRSRGRWVTIAAA